jgi:hypothetical protein
MKMGALVCEMPMAQRGQNQNGEEEWPQRGVKGTKVRKGNTSLVQHLSFVFFALFRGHKFQGLKSRKRSQRTQRMGILQIRAF